jgi:hypothetical protein
LTRRKNEALNPREKAVSQNISMPFYVFERLHNEAGSNGNISRLVVMLINRHFDQLDEQSKAVMERHERIAQIRENVPKFS